MTFWEKKYFWKHISNTPPPPPPKKKKKKKKKKITELDMTPLGRLGRKTSTQTNKQHLSHSLSISFLEVAENAHDWQIK